MPLSYDFDIHWSGQRDSAGAPPVFEALFRDPRTVRALKGADSCLREWLEVSGFGLGTYDSGAGRGRYPASDEAARVDVIGRLSDNLRKAELKRANLNGFDLSNFLKAVIEAKPVGAAPCPARRTMTRPRPKVVAVPGPEAAPAASRVPEPVGAPAAAAAPARARVAAVPPVEAQVAAVMAIDAAFANPKAGAPLRREQGREPTVEDLMAMPERYDLPPVAIAGPAAMAADDLKYHPTTLPPVRKSGMAFLPLAIGGAALLYFLMFVVLG